MRDPCTMCNNYAVLYEDDFRTIIGCNDDKKKEGFHYDNFSYWHTCDNQNIREECKDCEHNTGIYCRSVMAFVNGKCIDRKPKV